MAWNRVFIVTEGLLGAFLIVRGVSQIDGGATHEGAVVDAVMGLVFVALSLGSWFTGRK
jgi:hypothetical protein